jgi:hypothetical protein
MANSVKRRRRRWGLLSHSSKKSNLCWKALGTDEQAQENRRLKGEVVVFSNASAKATRLGDELAVAKAAIKDLRTQISKGTTGYTKVNSKYQQLKKDAAKAETALKKDVAAFNSARHCTPYGATPTGIPTVVSYTGSLWRYMECLVYMPRAREAVGVSLESLAAEFRNDGETRPAAGICTVQPENKPFPSNKLDTYQREYCGSFGTSFNGCRGL